MRTARKKLNRWLRLLILCLSFALLSSACATGPFGGIGNVDLLELFRRREDNEPLIKPELNGKLTDSELLRSLILALPSAARADAIYKNIPAQQLDAVTRDEFQMYARALRQALPDAVTSFETASADEQDKQLDLIRQHMPALGDLIEKTTMYWLNCDESPHATRLAIFLQRDAEGMPYLSRDWILSQLKVQQYAQLYFAAINKQDLGGLTDLLLQSEPLYRTHELKDALTVKAQVILDYYLKNLNVEASGLRLQELMPGQAVYQLPGISHAGSSHTVIFQENDGILRATEPLSDPLDPADTAVYNQSSILISGVGGDHGLQLNQERANLVLGPPLSHTEKDCQTDDAGVAHFKLVYLGLILEGSGQCQDHADWSGSVRQIELFYSRYQLGSGLAVGMPASEVIRRYPFAQDQGWTVTGSYNNISATLRLKIEAGYLTQITISFAQADAR